MAVPDKMDRMPNTISLCVDDTSEGNFVGRIYHFYSKDALLFTDLSSCINTIEAVLDAVGYPDNTVRDRVFKKGTSRKLALDFDKDVRQQSINELAGKSGKMHTVIMCVNSRNNASWQGEAYVKEEDKVISYKSALDLVRQVGGTW